MVLNHQCEISAPMWNDKIKLTEKSYSISDIHFFLSILSKT